MAAGTVPYQSLADQVSARIVEGITKGRWVNLLPSERALTEHLGISRKTLRKALKHLEKQGVIATTYGINHRIIGQAKPARRRPGRIALLLPGTLGNLRHFTTLWIDDLRARLFEHDIKLTIFSGPHYFTRTPGKALATLTEQNPDVCWVLSNSTKQMQQWFADSRIPCCVVGSSHPDVSLPNVHIDYLSVTRHAVGVMTRRGHGSLAYLTPRSQRAGDLQGEAGFAEGVARAGSSGIEAVIIYHDRTTLGVATALAKLLHRKNPPSVILINNAAHYLTAATFLADQGLHVGKDISLISCDDDLYLNCLIPTPARYVCNYHFFAKELTSLLLALHRGEILTNRDRRVEPKFVAGASLAQAAAGKLADAGR